MEFEGDPEHVQLLLKELAMGKRKPAITPRAGASGPAKADRLNLSSGELEYDQQVSGGARSPAEQMQLNCGAVL